MKEKAEERGGVLLRFLMGRVRFIDNISPDSHEVLKVDEDPFLATL